MPVSYGVWTDHTVGVRRVKPTICAQNAAVTEHIAAGRNTLRRYHRLPTRAVGSSVWPGQRISNGRRKRALTSRDRRLMSTPTLGIMRSPATLEPRLPNARSQEPGAAAYRTVSQKLSGEHLPSITHASIHVSEVYVKDPGFHEVVPRSRGRHLRRLVLVSALHRYGAIAGRLATHPTARTFACLPPHAFSTLHFAQTVGGVAKLHRPPNNLVATPR